jgi:hypothetical protein
VFLPLPNAEVFTTGDAVGAGATSRQLEWAVRGGRLHRLRRGVLCRAEVWAAADATGRAALLARAQVLAAPSTTGVVSHVTAAALLGLPLPDGAAGRVWVATLSTTSQPVGSLAGGASQCGGARSREGTGVEP